MALQDKAALNAQIATLLADNVSGDISEGDVRKVAGDNVDSNLNLVDTGLQTVAGPVTHSGAVIHNSTTTTNAPVIHTDSVDFQGPVTGLDVSAVPLLVANDFTTQTAAGTDITQNVTFGPAQNTGLDPVMIDAAGLVTYNQAITAANQSILAAFGRSGTGGVSSLWLRSVFNFGAGDIASEPINIKLDNANFQFVTFVEALISVPAGTTYRVEWVRDPGGDNSGDLISSTPTATGWPSANASATLVLTGITSG